MKMIAKKEDYWPREIEHTLLATIIKKKAKIYFLYEEC